MGKLSFLPLLRGKARFHKIIRTPFGLLLTFVSTKQKSLHYLSFRQTVAQQGGNLASKQARPANRGLEKPQAINYIIKNSLYPETKLKLQLLPSRQSEWNERREIYSL